jgi:hypothetical protein
MNNKKGQLSIINLISWLILVILGVILTPIVKGFTAPLISATNSTGEIILLNAVPIVMWLLIIGVLVIYATPRSGNAPPLY